MAGRGIPWVKKRRSAAGMRAGWRVIDGERSAGTITVQYLAADQVPTLPRQGSFGSSEYPTAFWRVGNTLLIGSPARIVLDSMVELGLPRPVDTSQLVWSQGLFEQLGTRLSERDRSQGGVTPTAEVFGRIEQGQPIPRPWLRALLWWTYSRDAGDWQNVLLPVELQVPRVGARAVGDQRATAGTSPFNPSTLAVNPWQPRVVALDGFDVTGNVPVDERPKKPNTRRGGAGVGIALATIVVLLSMENS